MPLSKKKKKKRRRRRHYFFEGHKSSASATAEKIKRRRRRKKVRTDTGKERGSDGTALGEERGGWECTRRGVSCLCQE
jgi:hypothetical protein